MSTSSVVSRVPGEASLRLRQLVHLRPLPNVSSSLGSEHLNKIEFYTLVIGALLYLSHWQRNSLLVSNVCCLIRLGASSSV